MGKAQHRHDINDKAWVILEPILPGQRSQEGAESPKTTADLSMTCSRFFAQAHHGAIYRCHMGNRAWYTSDSVAGEIKVYGKGFWRIF